MQNWACPFSSRAKMGNVFSRRSSSSSSSEEQDSTSTTANDELVVVTNAPEEVLHYDPSESYLVAFGIDKQHADGYQARSLGDVIRRTAQDVTLSFVDNDVVPQENAEVFVSSLQQSECSLEGMKREIKKQASRVTNRGLLVVCLNGHGMRQNRCGTDWGFVPGDSNFTPDSLLSPSALKKCLLETQCTAKYTLFVLDCCYSGYMAMKLTSDSGKKEKPFLNTYVLASCTANETSLPLNSLGYSVFSYFLRYSLDRVQPTPGCLPLADVFKECRLCTEALSSIIIRYDSQLGLKFGRFTPSMAAYAPQTSELDSVPVQATRGNTSFVFKYYQAPTDFTKRSPLLQKITTDWLDSLCKLEPSPLQVLEERSLLDGGYDTEGRILTAVITLLIHSIASIELVYNNDNVTDPNLFLLAFIEVMATLDRTHRNIEVTSHHLLESLPYYMEVLAKKKLDCSQMTVLYRKVAEDVCSVQLDSVEEEDSEVVALPRLTKWTTVSDKGDEDS